MPMFDLNQLKGALAQYAEGSAQQNPDAVKADFDQVSRSVPPESLAEGLSHAFRSDQTPQFGQMLSQLFQSGNGQQKAGLLNTLLGAVGGASNLGGAGGALSSLMGSLGGGERTVNPAQANQVAPDSVEQLAQHAQQQNPSVIDEVSRFLTQHPGWVKTLGSGALSLAMRKMAQHA